MRTRWGRFAKATGVFLGTFVFCGLLLVLFLIMITTAPGFTIAALVLWALALIYSMGNLAKRGE